MIGFGLMLAVLAHLLAITTTVMAGPNIKGYGTLNAVEEQGGILIITTAVDSTNEPKGVRSGGYQVSPYALILDGRGRKTTLNTYNIPTKVEFEMEYTPTGPLVKKVREIPQ
jgi:hypothetical protein